MEFHIGLFATLLAAGCLEVILCGIQMINGLFGCLCGTCMDKGVRLAATAAAANPNSYWLLITDSTLCCNHVQSCPVIILTHFFFFIFITYSRCKSLSDAPCWKHSVPAAFKFCIYLKFLLGLICNFQFAHHSKEKNTYYLNCQGNNIICKRLKKTNICQMLNFYLSK